MRAGRDRANQKADTEAEEWDKSPKIMTKVTGLFRWEGSFGHMNDEVDVARRETESDFGSSTSPGVRSRSQGRGNKLEHELAQRNSQESLLKRTG